MNYRHAFHAGNIGDVLKHATLARILTYMKTKDTPFRVIDTHAGLGLYDLTKGDAQRTGEWKQGIGRVEQIAWEVIPEMAETLVREEIRKMKGNED